MNILFNFSTNVIGGGMKNALQFINQASEEVELASSFHFAIPKVIEEALSQEIKDKITYFEIKSPARNISARKSLRRYCKENSITLVYTMAGPAYVNFPCYHIMGLSDPFIYQASLSQRLYGRTITQIIAVLGRVIYKRWWADRADLFLFQTEASREAFLANTKLSLEMTKIIPNGFDIDIMTNKLNLPSSQTPVSFLVPCPAYPHKALHQLPELSAKLSALNVNHSFYLTIDRYSKIGNRVFSKTIKHKCNSNFHFLGYQKYRDMVKQYNDCHFVILPSVLETFSSTILEAFIARRALILNDEVFNRDIAGSAAFYINIRSPQASAEKMVTFLADLDAQSKNIKQGVGRLNYFISKKKRFQKVMEVIVNSNYEKLN